MIQAPLGSQHSRDGLPASSCTHQGMAPPQLHQAPPGQAPAIVGIPEPEREHEGLSEQTPLPHALQGQAIWGLTPLGAEVSAATQGTCCPQPQHSSCLTCAESMTATIMLSSSPLRRVSSGNCKGGKARQGSGEGWRGRPAELSYPPGCSKAPPQRRLRCVHPSSCQSQSPAPLWDAAGADQGSARSEAASILAARSQPEHSGYNSPFFHILAGCPRPSRALRRAASKSENQQAGQKAREVGSGALPLRSRDRAVQTGCSRDVLPGSCRSLHPWGQQPDPVLG